MKTILPAEPLRFAFGFFFFLAVVLAPVRVHAQVRDSLAAVQEVDSLLAVARTFRLAGKANEALSATKKAVEIAQQKLGENNAKYVTSLPRLAGLYVIIGETDKAEELYLLTLELGEKVLGKDHPDFCKTLNNLAILYDDKGNFDRAEQLYLEALNIREHSIGKKHPDYASSLVNLASLYSEKGNYSKAEPLLLEALETMSALPDIPPQDLAMGLNNLANLYKNKGNYALSEQLHLKTIEIRRLALGRNHPDYVASLNNLANVYWNDGNYSKAEMLFLESKDILEKNGANKKSIYASVLNNLANLYREKGDDAKAEPLLLESIFIRAAVLGKKHPDYARSLNSLAHVYSRKGLYEKADSLFLEAKKVREEALGKEHPDYATSLNSLANFYSNYGQLDKAEALYLEAASLRERVLGTKHPDYAMTLYNLATLYLDKKKYAQATPMLLNALDIWTNSYGPEHPFREKALKRLANFNRETNQIPESASLFLELNRLIGRLIEKSAAYSSESQMLAYLKTFDDDLAQFQSFAQTYPTPDFSRATYNNALFYNGYLLENSRRLARSVAQADSLTRDTYERWQGCKRRLANEYAKPIAERKYVAEVETEAEGFEKSLTRNLANFGAVQKTPQWQDVRDRLHAGEAALEFIHFQYYTPKATDSTLYTALLLLPGDTCPHLIPLFEEHQLDQLLAQKRQDKRYEFHANAPSLYSLVWQPLDALLQGVKTVYYAPSGALHSLNLDAIAVDANGDQTLIDRYNLVRLGSTRQLVIPVTASISNNDALLFGGIRYEADSTAIQIENRSQGITMRGSSDTAAPDSLRLIGALDPLPGTKTEAEFIRKLLQQKKFNTRLLTGFAASEEAFKQLADSVSVSGQSARVIHLATHGYFFPDPKKQTQNSRFGDEPAFRSSEHPFLRSGLVLAGGNHAWQTGKPFNNGMEDGILTAYDISAMSLQNTELVVLSACETGLGDVAGNEGVFGLQRAFKIAGAQYLIMSLWNVPDAATKDLMSAFYNNWLNHKMDIPAAFRAAQLAMKARYNDPEMWAGFILVR